MIIFKIFPLRKYVPLILYIFFKNKIKEYHINLTINNLRRIYYNYSMIFIIIFLLIKIKNKILNVKYACKNNYVINIYVITNLIYMQINVLYFFVNNVFY